jgi:hypothetical protein
MLPTFIHSTSEFQSAVQLGSMPESLVLEFKETINDWSPPAADPKRQERRKEAQKEMCRDIAQFANTLGGCLLVGVSERLDATRGIKVADSIAPIQELELLRQWIEQAIVNYLVPTTFTYDVVAIALSQGNILAVNVPASRHLVSLWDRAHHPVEYVRRTSHGKDWMNPDEAERHIMNGSRAAKLALLSAQQKATSNEVEVIGGFWQRHPHLRNPDERCNPSGPVTFGQSEEYWFELRVPVANGVSVTIPYGVIEEAWISASGRVNLLLSVRLIVQNGGIILEPYR